MSALLTVEDIEVVYDRVVLVLKGVSLTVPEGGIVALLGANGAGKSTTLKAISNVLLAEGGSIVRGAVRFAGARIDGRDAAELVGRGIVQVMEGRRIFDQLTVEENLRVGAYGRADGRALRQGLDRIYAYFPRLKDRRGVRAGYLSGGEQQMAAIGRALMSQPRLMLLDEPSMGLAPMLVKEIFEIIGRLNREENVSILVAEQNAHVALSAVGYGYVMENGRIAMEGPASTLRGNAEIRHFYLGLGDHGQARRFREMKESLRPRKTA